MLPRRALRPSADPSWVRLESVQELLGISFRAAIALVYRGPLNAKFNRYGELVVEKDSVAAFVAERRAW